MQHVTQLRQPTERSAALAELCLATRRFGIIATEVVTRDVGADYTDNATVACLGELGAGTPLRLRDLAARIGLPSSTLSRTVDRLELYRDVVRRHDGSEPDRRAVYIETTVRGRQRVNALDAALRTAGPAIRPEVETALRQLDLLADENVVDPIPPVHVGLCATFARLGLQMGAVLKSISMTGDLTEALALMAMVDPARRRPTAIAQCVGLSSGGTTKVLDRLDEEGSIERSFGVEGDRRGVEVQLTELGVRQLDEMADELQAFIGPLADSYTALLFELS